MNRAFFLDRDGVINEALWNPEEQALDSPYSLDDFRLLPDVAQALRRIKDLGFLAVVISNQPGVAKGKCTPEFLDEVTSKMQREFESEGASLDGIYYCVHHPNAEVPKLRVECDCRKPKPGMFLQAAHDLQIDVSRSYMVGDMERDMEAASRAGCTGILVETAAATSATPHLTAKDLLEATEVVARIEQDARVMQSAPTRVPNEERLA